MAFTVKFTATVTGAISNLDVLILDELVPSPGHRVNVTESYISHGTLTVAFRLSALIGTDFGITYNCTTSGSSVSDSSNPSPLQGRVVQGNFIEVRLHIPV